jgi:hypothetical protein
MTAARRPRLTVLALLLCALPDAAAPLHAPPIPDVPPPPQSPAATVPPPAADAPATGEAGAAGTPVTDDGCGGEPPPGTEGLDSMRAGIQRGVCRTARFVDRVFGGEKEYLEYEDESSGRVALAVGWNEIDGVDVDTRFRASVNLPQINERFNATIGRASPDEYVADESGIFNPAVGQFSDDQPAEWFAGIGYRAHRGRDSRFDLGAGLKLETPLNPYVNARYRHYIYGRPGVLYTLRTTAFVENDEGFGLTQAIDYDKVVHEQLLFRVSNSFRWSEETRGVRWRVRPALYQAIDYRQAMRYEAYVRGETDGNQPDLYGIAVTHRRSAWRDWLFLEFGAELFWADGVDPSDRCEACIGATIGFEILFGEAYDNLLRRDARELPPEAPTPAEN